MRFDALYEELASKCPGVSPFERLAVSASVVIPFDERAGARRCLDRLVRREEIVLEDHARLAAVVYTSRRGDASKVRVHLDVPVAQFASGVVSVALRAAADQDMSLQELLAASATSSPEPAFTYARLFDRARLVLVDGRFGSDMPVDLTECATAGVLLADAAGLSEPAGANPYETAGLLVRALCDFPDIERVAAALDQHNSPVRVTAPRGAASLPLRGVR